MKATSDIDKPIDEGIKNALNEAKVVCSKAVAVARVVRSKAWAVAWAVLAEAEIGAWDVRNKAAEEEKNKDK
jgi:hypothetical protein